MLAFRETGGEHPRRLAPAKVSSVPLLQQESRISTPTNLFTKIYVLKKQPISNKR
jgi:hypothetical protein